MVATTEAVEKDDLAVPANEADEVANEAGEPEDEQVNVPDIEADEAA